MSTDLVPPPSLETLVARAAEYAQVSRSDNTTKAYASDLRQFKTWADEQLLPVLPVTQEIVACYVAHLADSGKKASTIARALSAIYVSHKDAGYPIPKGPRLDETLEGVRRKIGTAPKQKAPLSANNIRKMVDGCDMGRANPRDAEGSLLSGELLAARDRLLLVLGWTGAFRRSELVGLQVADVTKVSKGLEVTLRRSKTDQHGEGRKVAVPRASDSKYCAVALLEAWLDMSGISEGPLFRNIQQGCYSRAALDQRAVALIVKRRAKRVGLNADEFSGHSLRSGLVTAAANEGRSLVSIMRTTGHRSERTCLKYVRGAELWTDCAAKGLL